MYSTEYLYGIKPMELENKFYFEALEYKRNAGVRLYRKLFLTDKRTEEEEERYFHVGEAVTHTEKLIEERGKVI